MAARMPARRGEVCYRPIRWDDIEDIVTSFDLTWGTPGKAVDTVLSRLTSRRFVLHYLAASTWVTVATLHGRFMGLVVGRVPGDPLLFEGAAGELRAVDDQLQASEAGRVALRDMRYWIDVEHRLEVQAHVETGHAEVELFIVDAASRGHGVGRELWRRVMAHFADRELLGSFLHTDSSCDVGFYDAHGLVRAVTRRSDEHPEDLDRISEPLEDLFIYVASPRVMARQLSPERRGALGASTDADAAASGDGDRGAR